MSQELPKVCLNCTKTGMNAIGCPIFTQVPESLSFSVNCATAHYDKESRETTGGKILGPVYRNNKPPVTNSAEGRAKATHSRSGAF